MLKIKQVRTSFNRKSNFVFSAFVIIGISLIFSNALTGQDFYCKNNLGFIKFSADIVDCGDCAYELIGPGIPTGNGLSFGPDGKLYGLLYADIYEIDPVTGSYGSPIFSGPSNFQNTTGFVSVGGGIFYSASNNFTPSDIIWEWDTNAGTVTSIGGTGHIPKGEMAIAWGTIYYSVDSDAFNMNGILALDVANPANSQIVVDYPMSMIFCNLTASPICNTLLAFDCYTSNIVLINLIDGSLTTICENIPGFYGRISSMWEFAPPAPCLIELDLDCNDSSGATDADFNSPEFDCLSPGVPIADTDIKMLYDAIISTMTIQVIGNVPDAPFEIVDMIGSVPNINVMGDGTDMIILSNAGGAKSTDFKAALQQILYRNTAEYPTAGPRTVEVQFTTESGMSSNIATAFIEVNELPLIPLDLGPDQEICQGESATFDAGVPNATYQWSSGQTSQSITVSSEGEYIVTVSNNIECPNKDTVLLDVLPIIHVSLTGDDQTCDNEAVNLTITSDAPFPIDVEITPDPGSPFTIYNITGSYSIIDVIAGNTDYVISNVITSQPACVELTDAFQIVEVLPTYNHSVEVNLCEGDSIWLGFYWETEAGIYENTLNTIDFCDSVVTTTINILPAVNIALQSTTCDSAAAGVFYQYLNNPTGCDTVIETTVTLLPSDTTYVSLTTCNSTNTGVVTDTFTNITGCDSLVITTTFFIPPLDTTMITQSTCDSMLLGTVQQLHIDQGGCDSIVIVTTVMSPADTTHLFSTSCELPEIGVFQYLLENQNGCDSLIISTVAPGIGDTTYTTNTSCDSSSLGVFEEHFISQLGCDSTVFTTITYSVSDSTFLNSTSCDPDEVGVFISQFINRFGCDSIVTQSIILATSHNIILSSSSCNAADTGVFVQNLVNEFGCDSIVTETITLIPGDETFISSTTCMSSEAGVFVSNLLNQNGCDSIVTLTVALVPADTTTLAQKTCDPNQTGSIEVTHTSLEGCDSLVITATELYPLPDVQIQITSDFNGYAISCEGEGDGSVVANVFGEEPFSYVWSTGSFDQSITGLAAGAYAVTVTDGNGCMANREIVLFDPPPFTISLIVSHPDCFDDKNGSITITQSGGIEPIRYSTDGINFQESSVFNELSEGSYQITAYDANDCEVKEIILINAPLQVDIELGDDMIITPGDSATIHAIVNVPFDSLASVVWTGLNNPPCENCLTQIVAPIITTTYSVKVATHDGCTDQDQLTLFVERENDVYVPNIFSPNGDGVNDELVVYGGEGVEEIASFIVFDRWGNVVFSAEHFQVNDVTSAWDGGFKGQRLNPGVFAYKMIVKFKDGTSDVVYGDVTLLR